MEKYLNEFIEKLKLEGKSINTIKSYKAHMQEYFQWFADSFGNTEFKGLYRSNIQEYKNYLKNIKRIGKDNHNLDGKTINAKLSALAKYNELMQPDNIVISKSDYIKIQENASNRLKDDWLIIKQKKHITNYDHKSKKKKKRRVKFNMNKVMDIAGAKSYKSSFTRFNNTAGIVIEDDEEKEQFRIKFDILDTDSSEVLFNVGNIYDCMTYLQAYEQGKKIHLCKVCGKGFIKESNNQKTCGKDCQDILRRMNQARTNEKNRKAALEAKQAI